MKKHFLIFTLLSASCVSFMACETAKKDESAAQVEPSGPAAEAEQEIADDATSEADSVYSEEFMRTSYSIGSSVKNGYNIGMRLDESPTDPNQSVLKLYRTVREGGQTKSPVEIAVLNDKTVELFLTSSDFFTLNVLEKDNHFSTNKKVFDVDNSIDFKISTAFQGVLGSRYVVGTEDDRTYTDRTAPYANILFNKDYLRKVRFSYKSTGGKTGKLTMSSVYTVFSIDKLDCQKKFTGIEEKGGWGISYTKCCAMPCPPPPLTH
jgi:hypothetical protein